MQRLPVVLVSCSLLTLPWSVGGSARGQDLGGWSAPPGGWDYVYQANADEDIQGDDGQAGIGTDPRDPDPFNANNSLDGTWHHNNGSDEWDGSGPGDMFRPDGATPASPGGAGIVVVPGAGEDGGDASVLSIVDTGDPRARFPDPGSNRKTWFCHDVAQEGVNGGAVLRNGFTLLVRSRLHPDIDPATPGWQLPDGGLDNDAGQGVAPGYTLRDGGKGGHGYYDAGIDRNFSLAPFGTRGYQLPPLVGEGLPPATFLDLGDNTVFHALWITISDADANDRFDVAVYVDGATTPTAQFPGIQIGDDTDCDGISHLHMGFHSTPQIGGMQVDYFGYKIGLFTPTSNCPGGFLADFNEANGQVALSWSPAGVDSYTIRRDGAPLQEGIPQATTTFVDPSPTRPSATYELVPIVGGQPKPGCNLPSVAVDTVVCPVLTCVPDRAAGSVVLNWTAPAFFTATSYNVIRDGTMVGTAPGSASTFTDTNVPAGEHTYELGVVSTPPGACPANPFCVARLFARGAIDISGDTWDAIVVSGVTAIVVTTDGVKSLYFPPGPKGAADTASFAVQVDSLGAGGGAGALGDARFRVEMQARYEGDVRVVNRSTVPESYVQFELSRTGVSRATDENGNGEDVEQVPAPGGPTVDSGASTIVNTDTVGLKLAAGLNVIDVLPVDAAGTPHDDEIQIFALRIGPFAVDLDARLTTFPCASGFACLRQAACGEEGTVELTWTSGEPHAYEIRRDGVLIATLPPGATTSYTDRPGVGFFTYSLRATDSDLCPEVTCTGGGGAPDAEGFIREWLILGPLYYGCVTGGGVDCAAPGVDVITRDYLQGTAGGNPVNELTIAPVEGTEIVLTPPVTVRAAPRAELNPGRPAAARWFRTVTPQALNDAAVFFGGDPGNDYMLYGVTYVNNTTGGDLTADLGVTSDDSVQVYINDLSVHVNNVPRPVGLPGTGNFDVVPGVTLREGINRIMVKVFEGGGDTGFGLRFQMLDDFGFEVPVVDGIEVALCPEAPDTRPEFIRADVDAVGGINITDGVYLLNNLFLGGPAPPCRAAADANDLGQLNITTAVYVFNFLFLGGPRPPPPYPACGRDPTPETSLDCARYECP